MQDQTPEQGMSTYKRPQCRDSFALLSRLNWNVSRQHRKEYAVKSEHGCETRQIRGYKRLSSYKTMDYISTSLNHIQRVFKLRHDCLGARCLNSRTMRDLIMLDVNRFDLSPVQDCVAAFLAANTGTLETTKRHFIWSIR